MQRSIRPHCRMAIVERSSRALCGTDGDPSDPDANDSDSARARAAPFRSSKRRDDVGQWPALDPSQRLGRLVRQPGIQPERKRFRDRTTDRWFGEGAFRVARVQGQARCTSHRRAYFSCRSSWTESRHTFARIACSRLKTPWRSRTGGCRRPSPPTSIWCICEDRGWCYSGWMQTAFPGNKRDAAGDYSVGASGGMARPSDPTAVGALRMIRESAPGRSRADGRRFGLLTLPTG